MKRIVKAVIKILFVVALFYFLASKGFLSLERTKGALAHPELIIKALLIGILGMFVGAWRWQILMRPHGINLGYFQTLELSLIGNFFNIALPGAVSGDFVKAFYIGKRAASLRASAFGSIVFDRVIGLSALGLLSGGALILDLDQVQGQPLVSGVKPFLIIAVGLIIAFYTYLFLLKENHDPLLKFFKKCEDRWERFGSVYRIYVGIRHYHFHPKPVIQALILTLLIHMGIGYSCGLFAQALGAGEFPLLSLYIVVPIGLLVSAIPIAPAGMGTGHVAFATLFSLLGSPMGADIFSWMAISSILIGAIGGVVYLRYKSDIKLGGAVPSVES